MSLEKQKRVDRSIVRVPTREPKSTASSEIWFTSDRKGDPQNLTYASLDKYKVPKYRTTGYGRLLGLDRRFRVVSSSDTRRDIQDEGNDSTRKNRSVSSLTTSRITGDATFIGKSTGVTDNNSVVDQQNFIRLSSRQARRKRRFSTTGNDRAIAIFDDSDNEKSNSGGSSAASETDQDGKDDPGDNAFEQFRNHPDNVKQVELTRRTDRNPADIEAWLALIHHQELYLLLSASTNIRDSSSSSQRMLAEVRLSLYERALAKVTAPEERKKLLLGYLQEGSKIWDTKTQLKQWKISLQQNQSIDMWYRYLDFQQSDPIIFTYEQCLEIYAEVLERIHKSVESGNIELHICYWTLRLTTFMFQSGFAERATAIWQALLEINFFTSSSVSEEHIMAAFEQFWDCESARLGEPGAKGWYVSDNKDPGSRTDSELPTLDDEQVFSSWIRGEEVRSRDDIMPARTLDDTIEDDPYRVIIFSDIKEFLNLMRSGSGKWYLLQAFLNFCGLPQFNDSSSEYGLWRTDAFLCDYRLRSISKDIPDISLAFRGSFNHFAVDSKTLFPRSNWFSAWDGTESANTTLLDFASRTLTQLVDSRPEDDHLVVYTIALKLNREPISARKYAKSILKKRSERLLLYDAYALLEASSGNHQTAVKVWMTALSMSRSLATNVQKQSIILWHDLILELTCCKEHHQAINALLALTRSGDIDTNLLTGVEAATPHAPNEYLRADRFYQDQISNAVLSQEWSDLNAYTSLWSMYRYLTKDYNLSEALMVFNSIIESLPVNMSSSTILGTLHQSRARLIHLHTTSSPTGYKPSELLPHLKESRILFPNNTIFHTLHEHYSRRAGLIDRLRGSDLADRSTSILTSANSIPLTANSGTGIGRTQRDSTLPSSLLKISLELSRPSYAGTTNHSIRSAFKKATHVSPPPNNDSDNQTDEPPARHNPATWISWLNWELSPLPSTSSLSSSSSTSQTNTTLKTTATTTQLKQLKDLYLTSLRSCPWSKELHLFGFKSQVLRNALGPEGLKEIYFSMREKGIRIRIDIGEFLGQ